MNVPWPLLKALGGQIGRQGNLRTNMKPQKCYLCRETEGTAAPGDSQGLQAQPDLQDRRSVWKSRRQHLD